MIGDTLNHMASCIQVPNSTCVKHSSNDMSDTSECVPHHVLRVCIVQPIARQFDAS